MTLRNLHVDSARLWDSLMEMARIGPGVAGGNNRQALTDADGEARHLFRRWCEEAGMTVSVDTMGSMFALRPGADPSLAPVCIGSHLDTQPTGGKYDGVLGVLAGLEVVRTLNDAGITTRHPLCLVNWTNEEGCRFAPAMMASGVFAGVIDEDWALDRRDASGLRFGDELARIGWKGSEPVGARRIDSMFELHIEQGPVLEEADRTIGVVTHGQGLRWIEGRLRGRAQHTGTTPMYSRHDCTLALARMIDLVREIALRHQPDAVGTIGHVELTPNSRNVIAGEVVFTADLRSHRPEVLAAMEEAFRSSAPGLAAGAGSRLTMELVGAFEPPAFDPGLARIVREAADMLGHSHMDIVSGAGHDACWINRVAPTVMIMCPCVGGLSHNEAEAITPGWAAAASDVLAHSVLARAGVVS